MKINEYDGERLSLKQEKFTLNYFETRNAGQSYIDAGYHVASMAVAMSAGSRLLKSVKVQAFLDWLRQQAINKSIADLTEVKQGLTQIFRGRMSDYVTVNVNGNAIVSPTTEALKSAAVQEITTRTERIGGGSRPITADITTIKLRDPVRAAELLSKISGWHTDGVNVYNDNRKIEIWKISDEELERIAAGGRSRALAKAKGSP